MVAVITFRLPPWLAWLPCVTAIVVAPASSATPAAETLSTSAGTVRLRFGFVDLQGAPAQLASIQRGDGFVGLTRVCHLHETEAACASRIAIGHDTDFFNLTVFLEDRAELRFCRAMR